MNLLTHIQDNGNLFFQTATGEYLTPTQVAYQNMPSINGVVLRKRNPDWVEIVCKEDKELTYYRVDFRLTDWQKQQLYEMGEQVLYAFTCPGACRKVSFISLIPCREITPAAPFIGSQLPEGIHNSGPCPY